MSKLRTTAVTGILSLCCGALGAVALTFYQSPAQLTQADVQPQIDVRAQTDMTQGDVQGGSPATYTEDVVRSAYQMGVAHQREAQADLRIALSTTEAELRALQDQFHVQQQQILAQSDAQNCVNQVREAARAFTVYFTPGGEQINSNSYQNIETLAAMLRNCDQAMVHVTGHSDASGGDIPNLILSWQRADAVVNVLENLGVDTLHVDALGFGSRKPTSQGDADGERDRRVEFHVLEAH